MDSNNPLPVTAPEALSIEYHALIELNRDILETNRDILNQLKIMNIHFTEWDGNVEFCCWHTRYDLGNSKRFGNNLGDIEDCQTYAKETNSILLPLFIYDHSGIALSLGREYSFNCRWDSGQLGYILIDRDWLKEHFGKKYFTKKIRERMLEAAKNNVTLYNNFLSDSVYGYNVEETGDSCYGFYGYDYEKSGLLSEAKSNIDWQVKENRKQHFAQLKQWIINKVPLQYREPLTV